MTKPATGVAGGKVHVGVDLVPVPAVAASLERWGPRYARRVFTPAELADTAGSAQASGLAARFATKEAVIKVLAPVDSPVPWRAIEVCRRPGGRCEVELSGEAAALAARAGLGSWSLSMCHEGDVAVAVVVAAEQPGGTPWRR
ncbi:MAG TPA: holo-ACP synthase [Acidimicrobiales bacterium]|nr:holo-ACP synthase [Acidimicrobiales bacterium]